MKPRSKAILIALFLGGFGFHRFYMNRPISGFIYLVFCWTLIPSCIAFLEVLFMTFALTDGEFNRRFRPHGQ